MLDMTRLVEQSQDLELALRGVLVRLQRALNLRGARLWQWEAQGPPQVAAGLGEETGLGPDAANRGNVVAAAVVASGREAGRLVVSLPLQEAQDTQAALRLVSAAAVVAGSILGLHQSLVTRCEESPVPEELDPMATHLFLTGQGAAMAQVCDLIKKVAPSEATVLLLGPRGAGKHLAARIIHQLSQRSKRPWARLVCTAWDQGELERRLFGEESGPGNGHAHSRPGMLERAAGGTLYLEEVGALGLPLQARLLRVLQEGEYEPSGGGDTRRASVRVVASSTQDLEARVAQGTFRQDLLYRLAVLPITLPPLKQRREDVAVLADHFLEKYCQASGRAVRLSPQAVGVLTHYAWPGNVAELDNLCQRLVLLARTPEVSLDDLPSFLFYRPAAPEHGEANLSRLEEMEKQEVVAALERNNWVQSHAAAELGLTLRQIGYRVKKFGLENAIKSGRRRNQEATF
ncbi:MAG: sigma-54 dependent transcriptional regulator [Desulfarculaceae bacterium]|nr:sigma-54 dependent transcriptional regulator [Desulfarculaceae bacterium]